MESTYTNPDNQQSASNIHWPLLSLAKTRCAMILCLGIISSFVVLEAQAQQPDAGISDIAQREIARRTNLLADSEKALELGRAAYAEKDFEKAVRQYTIANSLLPSTSSNFAERRQVYADHLSDASVALAQEYRRVGKYDEAREILSGVLTKNPTKEDAAKELAYLDDPIRTNPALDYEHTRDVDSVRKLLYAGEGHYNLGKYDQADAAFKKVLQIDPYNKAARRWLERVAAIKSDYYRAAYDQTRAQLLAEVDKAWELAVPSDTPQVALASNVSSLTTGVQYLKQKLDRIIIPAVDFEDVTVNECLETLRVKAKEFDFETDESRKGINFLIRDPGDLSNAAAAGGDIDLSTDAVSTSESNLGNLIVDELRLENIPLASVLQYICDKTRLRYKLDNYSVILLPVGALEVDDLYTRNYTVPPDFISRLSSGSGSSAGANADPFSDDADGGGKSGMGERPTAKQLLMDNGVSFPEQAFANYIASTSSLVVNNTLNNLDIIEQIIDAIRQEGPRQVRIMTKFIEVSQENQDELGFDWVINPIGFQQQANGTNQGSISGGTIGSGATRTFSDFGLSNASGFGNNINPDGVTTASNIATAGLRSGDYANTRNSIDNIINNTTRSNQATNVAPGILSITGLFDNGSAQMIMRGLAQKKGTDVMTAPSLLAKSGEQATIEIIREFIYPTEYEPPELPQSTGSSSTNGSEDGGGSSTEIFPVTPATPTGFETRNTGVTLEIEPTIGENNYTIDLRFLPELVEFEGFINYGSPIQTLSFDLLGNPVPLTITENRIEMPVFATRRVSTSLTVYDGYTVAVGGLMREDVQNVEDSVPILGDLPIIGRLFQTKAESRTKSNLIIFVTAEIIDAAGVRINAENKSGPSIEALESQMAVPLGGGNGLLPSR